jgi:omega-amidase
MHVAIIQSYLHWQDTKANLAHLQNHIDAIAKPVDLIVLPEMFTTGFSMRPQLFAHTLDSDPVIWLKQQSAKHQAVVCGSVMLKQDAKFYNAMLWVYPDGIIHQYNKRHLFSYGNEQQHYTAGTQQTIIEIKGWRINPVVCYDLRFPVWLRRTPAHDYDAMVVVANWPKRREYHWNQLLIARAIENQCYVVACNRVGNDGNNVYHNGLSCVIDPMGHIVQQVTDEEFIIYQQLVKSEVETWRDQFRATDDADSFQIT